MSKANVWETRILCRGQRLRAPMDRLAPPQAPETGFWDCPERSGWKEGTRYFLVKDPCDEGRTLPQRRQGMQPDAVFGAALPRGQNPLATQG